MPLAVIHGVVCSNSAVSQAGTPGRTERFQVWTFWTLECVFRGNVGIHRAPKAIQGDGIRPRRVSWQGFPGSSLSGTLVSYGASAVARTSDRGHVAEV